MPCWGRSSNLPGAGDHDKRRSSMNALKHGECSAMAIRARAERAATMRDLRRLMAETDRRSAESLRGGW